MATAKSTKKPTAKQLAARKLFAQRAKAGTLGGGGKKAPAKKRAAKSVAKPAAKKAVTRVSQVTKKAPTKRLVARRKKTMSGPKGYFANPIKGMAIVYCNGKEIAKFAQKSLAVQYAQAYADATGKQLSVEVL